MSVSWDGETAAALAQRLNVPRLELYDEVESTQDIAHKLAEAGTPNGTVVLAGAQRSGRGRMGRSWSSPPGQGVWCTLVERPQDLRGIDVLSVRIGLRLAAALDASAAAPVQLKWPNDLIVAGGKLGGILVEARWSAGGRLPAWVAIGVGVNVVAPAVEKAVGLAPDAKRVDVLAAIVAAVRSAASAREWLSVDELNGYATRDLLKGRGIVSPTHGIVAGIAESGALIVEGQDGLEQHRAGTVQLAEES